MGRKREKVGLIYLPTSNWIAGAYYVLNIIQALNCVEDKDKPVVVLFCNQESDFEDVKLQTNYPYLKKRLIYPSWIKQYAYSMRIIRKLTGIDFGDYEKIPTRWDNVKFIYPFSSINGNQNIKSKCLGWIPDFQEKYLKYLFSEEELVNRNESQKSFIKENVPLVFSSNDARNDFFQFHPEGKDLKTFVLHFAVTHPDFSREDIKSLKTKFGIEKKYFFCANQFWTHKNHLFLFEAFKQAIDNGLDAQLVCSGKLHDYRDDEYSGRILNFIKDNNLEKYILLTGFIEREEQLCLMDNSYAIIQPSLFEGWSTVVEDAKCLNKFIFLSNLQVHKEQIDQNVCFFDPHSHEDLVNKLLSVAPAVEKRDYSVNVKVFGEQFVNIIRNFNQ